MSNTADNERADPLAGLSQASMIDRPRTLGAPDPEIPDVTPPEPPPPPPKPPATGKASKSRGGGGGFALLLTLILCGGLGAAGYYAWTHPSPEVEQRIDAVAQQALTAADHVNAMSEQIAALTERVDRLEKAPPPAPAVPGPTDLGDLPKRVDDLTAKVDALANRPEPAPETAPATSAGGTDSGATQQALADLTQRVSQAFAAQKGAFDAEKAAMDQLSARLDQLAPRIGALEQGVGKQKGTAAEIARLARIEAALVSLQDGKPLGVIAGAPPEVARFATVAPPTEASLRESFPALAAHAQAVSQPDLSGRDFWQRALTRLQSAVTVRQGPDVLVGDPAAGILSDARQKVQDGDLAGAVTALRQLTGPAAAAMQDWVAQASALVAARAALADLAAHA